MPFTKIRTLLYICQEKLTKNALYEKDNSETNGRGPDQHRQGPQMETPPDAPIVGHSQGDDIRQRPRQQAEAPTFTAQASSAPGGT